MLHIKFDQDWPTGFRDIQVWKCGRRTDDGALVYYKLTLWAFSSCELIKGSNMIFHSLTFTRSRHVPRDLANVNEWQNHVWSLLLHEFKENTPKIEKMFAHFILQSYHHFLTRTCFLSSIRAVARYFFSWWFEGLARALRGVLESV